MSIATALNRLLEWALPKLDRDRELSEWRHVLLNRILRIAAIVIAVPFVLLIHNTGSVFSIFTVMYVALVAAAAAPNRAYGARACVLLCLLFAASLYALILFGIAGASRAYAIAFVVLAGALLGFRAGLLALCVYIAAALAGAYMIVSGVIEVDPLAQAISTPAIHWLSYFATLLVVAGLVLGSTMYLLRSLSSSVHELKRQIAETDAARVALEASETQYRLLAENVQDVIWTADLQLNYTYVSPSIAGMLGYDAEELRANPRLTVMTEESLALMTQALRESLDLETQGAGPDRSRTFELEFVRKDRSRLWVETNVSFLRDADGTPTGLVGVTRDISERRRSEDVLRDSEERFRQLAENIPEVFWIGNADWSEVIYISPSYENIWGRVVAELYEHPRSWLDAIVDEDLQGVLASMEEKSAGTSDDPRLPEFRILRPDGSVRWISTRVFPLRNEDGRVYRLVGISEDVTARRLSELALEERVRFLTVLSELSGAFINLSTNEIDEVIQRSLLRVAEVLDVERSVVWQLSDDGAHSRITHSHSAAGFEPVSVSVSEETFPWLNVRTRRGEMTVFSRIDDLPNEAKHDKEAYRAMGLKSGIVLPLAVGETLLGSVSFAWFRAERSFTDDQLQWLRLLSEVFANALLRKQAGEELARHRDHLEELVEQRTEELAKANTILQEQIDERVRAEEAVRESEANYRTLFDSSNDAVMILDDKGFLDCNAATLRMFGCQSHDEFCGLHPSEVSPPLQPGDIDSRELADRHVATAFRDGRNFFEWVHRRMDGTDFLAEVLLSPVEFRDKLVLQGTVRNVTERRLAEEEMRRHRDSLAQRTQELEEAQAELVRKERLAALGTLTATVAHEIRNPLGTVRNAVFSIGDALKHHEIDRIERATSLAERNIQRCDRIITELLDFTRKRVLMLSDTDIDSLLADVLEEYEFPEGIECVRELHAGYRLAVDCELLRRAVINVVTNAVQAMQEEEAGGKRLTVETRVTASRFEMRFVDNGPGIPADNIDRIFEPLFSTKSFGVGLGIPIVKDVMADHDGGVEYESEPGFGTTVTLWLPLSDVEA